MIALLVCFPHRVAAAQPVVLAPENVEHGEVEDRVKRVVHLVHLLLDRAAGRQGGVHQGSRRRK